MEFIVVEEEEIEELGVKSQLMLLQERQDRAENSGQVVSLLTPDKTTATIVVNAEVEILPSFEEIRSAMGFSPLNNTNDSSIPHTRIYWDGTLQKLHVQTVVRSMIQFKSSDDNR